MSSVRTEELNKPSQKTKEEGNKFKVIGTRPVRPDGMDKVTGKANFGADIVLNGMLYGAIHRSPHAHALIKKIDISKALKLEGVKSIITNSDLASLKPTDKNANVNFFDLARNVLAKDKVLYDGHAIAAIAAISQAIANKAAKLIEVEYKILKPVMDIKTAEKKSSPIIDKNIFTEGLSEPNKKPSNTAKKVEFLLGDPEKTLKEADIVLDRKYSTQTVHQGYIEPHACAASYTKDNQATIWCSSQGAFMVRAYTAKLCGLETSKIKVIPAEIGGGFGGKTTIYLEPLAVKLSQKTGRPVKIVMNRTEVMRATGPTSGGTAHVKLGTDKKGNFIAGLIELKYEAGAFAGSPVGLGCMTAFAPYNLKHVKCTGWDILVNRPKAAAYRAPGAPVAAFAVESAIDEIASILQMDPIELRLKNCATEGTTAPYGVTFDKIGHKECLEAGLNSNHYNKKLKPYQGRGVASGFWFNIGGNSSAEIMINEDGNVTVATGNPDIGGSRASMAMMAAETLGIGMENVKPIVADTESIPYSDLTGGSRVTFATGKAVIEAATDLIAEMCRRAAKFWKVDPAQVEWKNGTAICIERTDIEPMSMKQIAKIAFKTGGAISGKANINVKKGAGPGFGVHICDVEVDPETGRVTVLRYTAIQDVGKAIHPSYVEGQLQGGAAQGIGWALNEEYVYNEHGNLMNTGFLDYRIPVASDLPMIETILVEVPNTGHPFGVRGVGETPIVPPLAAVANAVSNAIDKRMTDLPLNPIKILSEIG